MAIIDASGLFKGKRLRKCSADARFAWPYLYLLSNGYGRIELDYDAISDEFASFREGAPAAADIERFLTEYVANHLIFAYQDKGQSWAQWDTRRSHLKDFKTAADKASPSPPEPQYTSWLKEQHAEDWRAYHWNKELDPQGLAPGDIPAKVPKDLPKPLPNIGQDFPLGVGVGVGVGVGSGEGQNQNQEQTPSSEVKSTSDQEGSRSVSRLPHSGKKLENQEAADRLTTLFTERIHANRPSARIKSAGWPQIADRMIRIDGRSEAEIAEVIEWCQRDSFWQSNILCMETLRKKFDQLAMKMSRNGTTKPAAPDLDGMEYGKGLERLTPIRLAGPTPIKFNPSAGVSR